MKTIRIGDRIPPAALYVFNRADGSALVFERGDDAALLSPEQSSIIAASAQQPQDSTLAHQFEAVRAAMIDAEFEAFKARAGQPSYKAAAVKIAAEKLGVLDAIDAAIMDLVNQASDKSLYVWWSETPTISRGDAEWQQIEPAVAWGKGVSADDLFALAAQI